MLGAADSNVTLMGASSKAAGGEAWAYRRLPLSVGAPVAGGRALQMGEPGTPPSERLAFLRYTSATGWQYVDTPLDSEGTPYRSLLPNARSARITDHGGGVLVARDLAKSAEHAVVVLRRDPGGRFQALPDPPTDVLLGGESLAENFGQGRAPVAAYDDGGKTNLFVAPTGPPAEAAVIHWNGTAWSREPLCVTAGSQCVPGVPAGAQNDFKILALAAAGPADAWLLARTPDSLGRGIVLFQRSTAGGSPHWEERSLGDSPFASRNAPEAGIADIRPLEAQAQPLTATTDGVWIDGAVTVSARWRVEHFTLFLRRQASRVTGSWCDPPSPAGTAICDHPLARACPRRSATAASPGRGDGFGSASITNPLVRPAATSSRTRAPTCASTATRFDRMPGGGGNFHPGGAFSSPGRGLAGGPGAHHREPGPERLGPRTPGRSPRARR